MLVRMDSNHHEDFSQRTLHALWSTHYPPFISYSPPPRQEGLSANFNTYQKVLVDLGSTNKTLREALPMVDLSHKKIVTAVRCVSEYNTPVSISFLESVPPFVSESLQSFIHNTPCV
jgi:hypothetical protein